MARDCGGVGGGWLAGSPTTPVSWRESLALPAAWADLSRPSRWPCSKPHQQLRAWLRPAAAAGGCLIVGFQIDGLHAARANPCHGRESEPRRSGQIAHDPPAETGRAGRRNRANGAGEHGSVRPLVWLDACPRPRPQRRSDRDRGLPRQGRQLRPPGPGILQAYAEQNQRAYQALVDAVRAPAGSRPKPASDSGAMATAVCSNQLSQRAIALLM